MVIKIEAPKKEGYRPTLKMKALLAPEYVIMCKDPAFDEPLTGTSVHGDWCGYAMIVKEYNAVDPKTLEQTKATPNESCTYFTNPGANVYKAIKDLPANVDVKIIMEEDPKSGKSFYKTEVVGAVAEATEPTATNPDVSADDKIKALKAAGVTEAEVLAIVGPQFDLSDDLIKARYAVL